MKKTLWLATGNEGKIQEYEETLDLMEEKELWEIKAVPDRYRTEIEEDGVTYKENARKKAQVYAELLNAPVLGDDGGLELHAFPGELGLKTQREAPQNASPFEKNEWLLEKLSNEENRNATLHAALVYVYPDGEEIIVEKETPFLIAEDQKGDQGFGMDPILYIPEKGKTTAELSPEERKYYSPRFLAFKELMKEVSNDL